MMEDRIRVTDLTTIGFELLGLLDSGKLAALDKDEIYRLIENGTVFDKLEGISGRCIFTHLTDKKKGELLEHWANLANATTSSKFLVDKGGVALLLGYVLEGLQNGTSRDGRLPIPPLR
jgi:hypothetical protein